jgi:hypothetical protein
LATTGPPSRTDLDPSGDLDSDGLDNLFEFACGLDPRHHDAAALPAPAVVDANGNRYLAFTYQVDRWAAQFLRTSVERSTDLGGTDDWSTGETTVIDRTPLSPELERVTERSNQPLSSQVREFLRLRVQSR